jgi:hypothetical protein
MALQGAPQARVPQAPAPTSPVPQTSQSQLQGFITLSSNPVYRGTTLYFGVNVGATNGSFAWSFAVQNYSTGDPELYTSWANVSASFNNINMGSWAVPTAATLGVPYHVVLFVYNGTDQAMFYENFTVLNNPPVINSVFSDHWSITRGNSFNITVNATDIQVPNLAPSSGTDPNTYVHVYCRDTSATPSTFDAMLMPSGNYSVSIFFPGTAPLGSYSFWAGVKDGAGFTEVDSAPIYVVILNNNPTIDLASGVTSNNQNGTMPVTVTSSDTLNLSVTAYDYENTITWVTFAFYNPDTQVWVNFTINYQATQNIVIAASDIGTGSWYLYIFVFDADNGVGTTIAPISVQINPDVFTIAAPIIGFLIGIPAGFGIGVAVVFWRMGKRSKTGEAGREDEEEPLAQPKARKGGVGKKLPEPKEEEPEESETEEEDASKGSFKRKIRRRIE